MCWVCPLTACRALTLGRSARFVPADIADGHRALRTCRSAWPCSRLVLQRRQRGPQVQRHDCVDVSPMKSLPVHRPSPTPRDYRGVALRTTLRCCPRPSGSVPPEWGSPASRIPALDIAAPSRCHQSTLPHASSRLCRARAGSQHATIAHPSGPSTSTPAPSRILARHGRVHQFRDAAAACWPHRRRERLARCADLRDDQVRPAQPGV